MPDSPPALRPCPWCGTADGLSKDGSSTFKEIMCNGCDCSGPIVRVKCDWRDQDQQVAAETNAAIAWNSRAAGLDPAAIMPDPDNERQRDTVADAMKQTRFASSWDEQARAVLTALRDMK